VSALGIEEQRVNAILDLAETDRRLGHGYRVFAEMNVWECGKCLQVPIGALFRHGRSWSVFVIDGERTRQADIEVGHMNDETVEVLADLKQGDTVVVHPADTLGDGSLVEHRTQILPASTQPALLN
jgi:HlyD family secretion protein